MKPTIGRIVHYNPQEPDGPRAAIITRVKGDFVWLYVFDPDRGPYILKDVVESEDLQPGTWSWPPLIPSYSELLTVGSAVVGAVRDRPSMSIGEDSTVGDAKWLVAQMVLRAKAEMPCYRADWRGEEKPICAEFLSSIPPCPSCAAKAQFAADEQRGEMQ